jgi:hypothetical protein
VGSPPREGLDSFQPAPGQYALGMEAEDLLEAIDDLSPEAQYVLLITIANHLREAVDEGRISSVVLTQAADHLRMLVNGEYGVPRQ